MLIEVKKILKIRNPSTGKFEPLLAIKGEPGGLSNITQEFGTSENLVVSQKAVSDAINTLTSSASSADATANYAKTLAESMKESWVKIASGTYIGDGQSTNTIKFDFTPVFLRIDPIETIPIEHKLTGVRATPPGSMILSGDMNQTIYIDTYTYDFDRFGPGDGDEYGEAYWAASIYCKTSLDTDNTLSLSRFYWESGGSENEWYDGIDGGLYIDNYITTSTEWFNKSGSTYRYFAIGI